MNLPNISGNNRENTAGWNMKDTIQRKMKKKNNE